MSGEVFQRLEMVQRQIERRGIKDPRVLKAMEEVPRETFVPDRIRHRAFEDGALPIDCGQTISQPYVVAMMTESLGLPKRGARVLEIGTGSGYAAAVLARLADYVDTIERHKPLVESARRNLRAAGCTNVTVHHGDGSLGWPDGAPYDGILVSAGAPVVPEPLKSQLAVDGRLVLPIGDSRYDQMLVRVTRRDDDTYAQERLGGVRFVPLIGRAGWKDDEDRPRRGWFFS